MSGRAIAMGLAVLMLTLGAARTTAQVATPAGADAWTAAIDTYLGTFTAIEAAPLFRVAPDDLRAQARQARNAWRDAARDAGKDVRADERRRALRRLQASALAPFEVLLPLSGLHVASPQWEALEDVAFASWEALPEFERLYLSALDGERQARQAEQARLASFRIWWRVAYLQYLLNLSRLGDFRMQLTLFDVDESDPRLRAEYSFLRGLGEETVARLSDHPSGPVRAQGTVLDGRAPAVTLMLRSARTWYRRALQADPAHAEAQLRLGRVLLENREIDEALRTLTPLASDRCTAVACGLAWLFIGEAQEAGASPAQAGAAYSRAAALLGTRQSALLALMNLAVRRGDVTAAYSLTAQLSVSSPLSSVEAADAWSTYVGGRRLDGEAVLAPLRGAAIQ